MTLRIKGTPHALESFYQNPKAMVLLKNEASAKPEVIPEPVSPWGKQCLSLTKPVPAYQ